MLTAALHDIPDIPPAHAAWATAAQVEESRAIYKAFPALKQYQEFLGPLRWSDICGQGAHAVIVRSGENFVGKYPRDFALGMEKELEMEFDRHNTILEIFNHGQEIGAVSPHIAIPRLRFNYNQNPSNPYVMEHVRGRNLFSIRMAKMHLPSSAAHHIAQANDFEIRDIILKAKGMDIFDSGMAFRKLDGVDVLRDTLPERVSELTAALEFLKTNGVRHKDLHEGNIMIGDNGKIYLIDFGIMSMERKKINAFYTQAGIPQSTLH